MREDTTLSRQLSEQVCQATGARYWEQAAGHTALGGIIADVMGLGKTLTTLTAILRSSEEALSFVFARPAALSLQGDVVRTKATLVVVPSARKPERPCQILIKISDQLILLYRASRELGIRNQRVRNYLSNITALLYSQTPRHSHFSSGALRYTRFHGQNRPKESKALQDYDIVLTTYATLAADHNGQGLMYRMEWYRVVLDEGRFLSQFAIRTC